MRNWLNLLLFASCILNKSFAQFHQQYGQSSGHSSTFQQSSSGGSFQPNAQRYQQTHVVVGPGPVIPNNGQFGGQFNEQRVINIRENIQGTAQHSGFGYGNYQLGQQQFGFGQNAQGGRSVFANNPITVNGNANSVKGAEIHLRLISYTNSGLKLPGGSTCNCPISNCNFVPINQQNQCQFSFVIVISFADQSIQYVQSNFYPSPTNGIMTTGNWTQPYTFQTNTKPVAIDVFVQHLGVVIEEATGQLLFFNHLSLVDSFVVDLSKFNGEKSPNGQQTLSLAGQLQQTQLQMSLDLYCINNMMGPLCDLTCNDTNAEPNKPVICYSNRTNVYSACKWNAYKTQVTDCTVCTNGVYQGACAGSIVVTNSGVSRAFRTWTIVLGCLLGIALLLILCLILSYIICFSMFNKRAEREQSTEVKESYENNTFDSNMSAHRKRNGNLELNQAEYSSNQPLITNEEWSSTTATRRPVGIFAKKNESRPIDVQHITTTNADESTTRRLSTHQEDDYQYRQQQMEENRQRSASNDYGRRSQDSPSTESSYVENGKVLHTTTRTTTTTRREHIV